MIRYSGQSRVLLAVDCLIFGFEDNQLKLLLVKRALEPSRHQWSLIGGFLQSNETLDDAAKRILKRMTGLQNVYLEPLRVFSDPDRDPVERTVSMTYFSLIDIKEFSHQINNLYRAEWFVLDNIPADLVFDHHQMVNIAKHQIKYRGSQHPILFELLPEKFTLQQLQGVYESVFGLVFDERNFHRKLLSSGLLIKQKEKDKGSSKKGAYYYMLDKERYMIQFNSFINMVPHSRGYIYDENIVNDGHTTLLNTQ